MAVMTRTKNVALTAAILLFWSAPQAAHAGFFDNSAYLAAIKADEEKDYEKARLKFEKLISAKDPEISAHAARRLFDYYMEGIGVAQDISKAREYLKMAAASRDETWAILASWRMGYELETGFGGALPPERIQAATYYRRAAELGDEKGAQSLEMLQNYPEVFVALHPEIYGSPLDPVAPTGLDGAFQALVSGDIGKATAGMQWHAKHGNEHAQHALGLILRNRGDLPSLHQATGWFYLSARSGLREAQRLNGITLLEATKAPRSEGLMWLSKSAEQGDAEAENLIGVYLANAIRGAEPDYSEAARHFRRAIELGVPMAATNLADLYASGLGVPKNEQIAIALYRQAVDAGDINARNQLFIRYNIVYDKSSNTPASYNQVVPRIGNNSTNLSPSQIYQSLSPSVFIVSSIGNNEDENSQGSSVAIGYNEMVTNCHVTQGSVASGAVKNGRVYMFTLLSRNEAADICVYRTKETLTPVMRIRPSREIKIGERVFAIGSPEGFENTLSEGIVSGIREVLGVTYIQTTAPIAHGSSGGGLFDEQGRLVGITSLGNEGMGNLNFAISADEIAR